ncbi:hypothetical protein ZIOFF_028116 [Zingiber officinale]|uniref:Uncharacterized protein n=1 Tax=Zingiber officinale TaxID=94328 RepID=A0A8J5GMM0_ZINOF|nr:hypothetical protein ZIOFF_028116 [Zingiber officinale]
MGENNLRSREHPKADATWIANVVKEKLRGEPSYHPCTIQKDLQRDYGIELDYHKVWKDKELAMHDIHGIEKGFYDRLRWCCKVIQNITKALVFSIQAVWANALFLSDRWGVMNFNNIAECWNNWVKPARNLPIVAMVDHIRMQIMNIIHRRLESTLAMVKELS